MNPKFQDAVLEHLNSTCRIKATGEKFQGQSVSHLESSLRYAGWKFRGYFPDLLEAAGFKIVENYEAQIESAGRWYQCRQVVTL